MSEMKGPFIPNSLVNLSTKTSDEHESRSGHLSMSGPVGLQVSTLRLDFFQYD